MISENPSLAEQGSVVYWSVCMACHGDQGQGLTDEFRQTAFGEDMNCWSSKCHGGNHPPEGFEFPRIVPPVTGEGTLRTFVTAADLQKYLVEKMPWWKPGSLSVDESWGLTAHLLDWKGVFSEGNNLEVKQAAFVPVHLPFRSQRTDRLAEAVFLATIGLATVLVIVENRLRSRTPGGTGQAPFTRPSFLHHLHPPTIPLPQARWRYTLGAGGLAIFLTLALVLTGILEMFFYIPTPDGAGASIQVITFLVPYGRLVRGVHFWAAQALVVVAIIHLLRVIFTSAFARPRRLNYLVGLGMLVLILFFDFTGYVLRWDEGIRWALTVGTNLLKVIPLLGPALYGLVIGGGQPGSATLTRFYTWHIFGLTAIMIVFLIWHIFRVRRDGGIAAPQPEQRTDQRRTPRAELVQREVLAMLVAGVALLLVGSYVIPPLAVPIQENLTASLGDTRAPWFFLWVQHLLRYGNAFWLGIAIPLGFLAVLIALPFIFNRIPSDQQGRWFSRAGRPAHIIAAGLVLIMLILTLLELFL